MKYFIFSCLLIIGLATSCSMPSEPEFQKLDNVKFKSLNLKKKKVTLTGNAIFNNPNALGGKMKRMNMEVFVYGKKVSDLKQNISTNIPADDDFSLPLEIEIPIDEVLKDVKFSLGKIIKSPVIKYRLKGNIIVGMSGIDVNIPVDFEDEEKLDLPSVNPLINTTIPMGR